MIQTNWVAVPCWVWYIALPQFVSRLTNDTPEMMSLAEQIIVAVVAEYPRQSGWYLVQLLNSRVGERKSVGMRLLSKITEKSNYPNIKNFLAVIKVVGECLVAVARFDPPANGGAMKAMSDCKEGSRLLRDTGGLLVMPVREQISTCAVLSTGGGGGGVFSNEIRIGKFTDSVYVYNTKAKPKRLTLTDTNGRSYSFILKLEKKTDLRKDSRVMEFVNVLNHESDCSMRTYSVLILSEDCAFIEFVPNLITMRKIIDESLIRVGKNVNMYLNKEVMNKLSNKLEGFAYFKSIVDGVSPMIAEWMLLRFGSDPRLWFQNRTRFTKTQAMWCIVGHVIVLGDRHPDNILIDQETGEIVHVDFDCIFSRGMSLNIPELVPFRLTKICVSAMGVTGVEGLFRHECETLLRLMRAKKKTLLAVLHAFIADPLIDWVGTSSTASSASATSSSSSYKKARYVIDAIEKKLNGFVDVGEIRVCGSQDEKLFVYNDNSDNAKSSGLGKDRGAALSVEGQVDELIKAAVCQRNLAKMYLGWMPLF
jgi:serine/threonine-protein kinase ATR